MPTIASPLVSMVPFAVMIKHGVSEFVTVFNSSVVGGKSAHHVQRSSTVEDVFAVFN